MTQGEILDRLRGIARRALGLARPLTLETDLLADLQLDSIQQLELVVEIENEFQICLDPEDEQGLATVSELVATVQRRLAAEERRGA